MSRKHYIKVAAIVREMVESPEVRERTARAFATMFKADNATFDKARFLAACGVGS